MVAVQIRGVARKIFLGEKCKKNIHCNNHFYKQQLSKQNEATTASLLNQNKHKCHLKCLPLCLSLKIHFKMHLKCKHKIFLELQWGIKTNKTEPHWTQIYYIVFFFLSFRRIIFLSDTGGARSNKKGSGFNVGGAGTCSGVFRLKLSPGWEVIQRNVAGFCCVSAVWAPIVSSFLPSRSPTISRDWKLWIEALVCTTSYCHKPVEALSRTTRSTGTYYSLQYS